ncbi:hypothetical protein [Actimicrobium sp. GrIS 1.19]|uniref:hypothetical protein n=1 Tax=Actimicrobium sp. GrIS 1.19 TaxID=3071708 RepID=UPI002E14D4DF
MPKFRKDSPIDAYSPPPKAAPRDNVQKSLSDRLRNVNFFGAKRSRVQKSPARVPVPVDSGEQSPAPKGKFENAGKVDAKPVPVPKGNTRSARFAMGAQSFTSTVKNVGKSANQLASPFWSFFAKQERTPAQGNSAGDDEQTSRAKPNQREANPLTAVIEELKAKFEKNKEEQNKVSAPSSDSLTNVGSDKPKLNSSDDTSEQTAKNFRTSDTQERDSPVEEEGQGSVPKKADTKKKAPRRTLFKSKSWLTMFRRDKVPENTRRLMEELRKGSKNTVETQPADQNLTLNPPQPLRRRANKRGGGPLDAA